MVIKTTEWNSVYHNPMGGFYVSGYVNNDKKMSFQIYFDKNDGKIECAVHACDNKLAKWKGRE